MIKINPNPENSDDLFLNVNKDAMKEIEGKFKEITDNLATTVGELRDKIRNNELSQEEAEKLLGEAFNTILPSTTLPIFVKVFEKHNSNSPEDIAWMGYIAAEFFETTNQKLQKVSSSNFIQEIQNLMQQVEPLVK